MVCLVLLLCACASFVVLVPAGVSAPVSYLSHSLGFSAMYMPSRLSFGTMLEQPKQSNESPEPHLLCIYRNSFGWRWYHLERTKLCFGHIFGQCLAGILSTINLFGGSRVSGFLDVFSASYAICDCQLPPHLAWFSSIDWVGCKQLFFLPTRANFCMGDVSHVSVLLRHGDFLPISMCIPCGTNALMICHVSHFTLTNLNFI